MKLNPDFITHDMDGSQFMVDVGMNTFKGVVRSNKTAAFIVNCLKEETTEDQIVSAMLDRYDASEETLRRDVKDVLSKLRGIGALDE